MDRVVVHLIGDVTRWRVGLFGGGCGVIGFVVREGVKTIGCFIGFIFFWNGHRCGSIVLAVGDSYPFLLIHVFRWSELRFHFCGGM